MRRAITRRQGVFKSAEELAYPTSLFDARRASFTLGRFASKTQELLCFFGLDERGFWWPKRAAGLAIDEVPPRPTCRTRAPGTP